MLLLASILGTLPFSLACGLHSLPACREPYILSQASPFGYRVETDAHVPQYATQDNRPGGTTAHGKCHINFGLGAADQMHKLTLADGQENVGFVFGASRRYQMSQRSRRAEDERSIARNSVTWKDDASVLLEQEVFDKVDENARSPRDILDRRNDQLNAKSRVALAITINDRLRGPIIIDLGLRQAARDVMPRRAFSIRRILVDAATRLVEEQGRIAW
jgi:hypothetical protein